jgi:glutamate/tyrosine decarboxylase-like PLP-dependent enzyme
MDPKLLARTAAHAQKYLDSLPTRPVKEHAGREELVELLGGPIPEDGEDALKTIDLLAHAGEIGTVACSGPRYFGFVIGGSVPAAQAADWLTTAYDQNAGLYAISPLNSVAEDIAAEWLLQLLKLPSTASVGYVTGGQMANFTGLAAGRNEMLHRAGWDVEQQGLQGAPKVNVVVGDEAHITIFNSLRLLGLGANTSKHVQADRQGRMIAEDLERVLRTCDGPTIICAQAGNVNSGAFDPIDQIADLAKQYKAWLHVDGAFGLWAAVSPDLQHHLKGVERADSWALDGHKWLNVPYDCGIAIVAHPRAHRAAFASSASYLVQSSTRRDPHEYVPEFSRRARGINVYAALRSLGRRGMQQIVERGCAQAKQFARILADDPRVRIMNEVVLNQVVVRFGDSDELTAAVIERVQQDGTCWLSGTRWQGSGAMRISVSNWSTTDADVDASVSAIVAALEALTVRNEVSSEKTSAV